MQGNLWVTEQLVASHIDDLRREAAARLPRTETGPRLHHRLAMRLGVLLMRAGRHLAGPEEAGRGFDPGGAIADRRPAIY
jgi:hypothetical protein